MCVSNFCYFLTRNYFFVKKNYNSVIDSLNLIVFIFSMLFCIVIIGINVGIFYFPLSI